MDDKFDGPLLGILQSCGELEPFLEVMLGFLYRKTDFYRPLSADQTMGFPEGVAKEKLLKVFGKFEKLASIAHSPPATHPPTPPATPGLLATSQQSSMSPKQQMVSPKQQMVSPKQQMVSPKQQMVSPVPTPAPNVTAVAIKEEIQGDWSTCNWDHHNGGVTEQYAWSQTAQDVELKLALPNPSIKASDLKIDIKAHSIKVQMKEEADMKTVLEKKLHSSVKPEESMWSLLKENNPNGQKQEEMATSPRWNQKFSSLVSRKKCSAARDKPQRVRGPAIQWSAETLFNSADEAKAYITRDNKWKFRYSHQTTEGKKVYYQCTQRAKLGCGALCHVVYHHVGTALLYTNGEYHNHLEYSSVLNNHPPPANVAISNAAALIQNIAAPTSHTTSSRSREDWTPVTIFQDHGAAKSFIEHEAMWKFSYSHAGSLGRKVFYDCAMKAKDGCPAKVQLLYHAEETTVSYMINGAPHKHNTDTAAVFVRKRGIPSNIKDVILEAYDNGFTDTKLVSKYLEIRGIEPPSASKIKVFLNRHRQSTHDNAPVSMLQWQFAPLTCEEGETVMGEVAAKC